MKIRINRLSFLEGFQTAALVAPSRSPKTILQNVKLAASENEVSLTATDMEIGVRLAVEGVEVLAAGAAVVPVARLRGILQESSDDTLEITADESKVLVVGGHSRFELQGQNPDEFPEVPDFTDSDYYEIPSDALRELIRRTLFATDAESSRYALSGVLLEIDGNTLTAVGTDGRRLAKMECAIRVEGKPSSGSATIVPARAMQLIERTLPHGDDPVCLAPRENELMVRHRNAVFFTRLVEGRFPKWRDVLPNRSDAHRISLPVGPMYSAVRQAAIVASEESRGVDFTFRNGSLILSNNTAEVGQSRIELPVAWDDEEELTITLDHRYVADFLRVLDEEKSFTFDIEDGEQAAYCVTDDNYGYVIMPLSRDRR